MTTFRNLATATLLGLSAFALTATSASASAPCRNAKGQFTKCVGSAATPAKTHKAATRTVAMRPAAPTAAKPAVRTAALTKSTTRTTAKTARKAPARTTG